MLGGVIAAPIAAWLVRIVPARLMGVLVGGFIVLTNVRILAISFIKDSLHPILYGAIIIIWVIAILFTLYKFKFENEVVEQMKY